MLAIYNNIYKFVLEIFLCIKTSILTKYVERALPSTGFDYWAALLAWEANQNKHLLPEHMSLPINDLPYLFLIAIIHFIF